MLILRNFFFIIVFLSQFGYAQDQRSWNTILSSPKFTLHEKQYKLDSLINLYKSKKDTDSILERITHKYAVWLYKNSKIDTAIHIAKYSQELKKKKKDIALLQHGLNNLGFFSYKNKNYTQSIKYYEQSIRLKKTGNYSSKAYSEIGKCYRELGDYYKSKTYFELAIARFKKNKDYKSLIRNAINSSTTYQLIGSKSLNNQGIKNLMLADSLAKTLNVKLSTKFNIKNRLGILYTQDNNIDEASKYFNEALTIAQTVMDSVDISATYGNLGHLYNDSYPDLAIQYQKIALDFTVKGSIKRPLRFFNIGYCQVLKGDYDLGINNYKNAIRLHLNDTISDYNDLLKSDLLFKSNYKSNLLSLLTNLGRAYIKKYKSNNEDSLLQKSIASYIIADQLLDLIRIESQEFRSKLYWRQQSSELYGRAIEACFLANNVEKAFYFMEKNKALLLSEEILKNKIKQSLKLPKKVIVKEISLRQKIYYLEKNKNIDKLDTITTELLKHKNNLQKLRDSIQLNFSAYTNFEPQLSISNINDIKKNLDEHTVILEYNITDHTDFGSILLKDYIPTRNDSKYGKKLYSKGYLLCITKNKHYFLELPNPDQLKSDIETLIKKASIPFKTKEDITSYYHIAYRVFNQLFPTSEIKGLTKNKNVQIVPDSYLNYVPFEALITNLSEEAPPKYLIEDCEVRYVYSNSFLKNTSETSDSKNNSFIGFAPTTFKNTDLIPLEHSTLEVSNIKEHFPGEIVIHENASKQHFLNTLKEHNIIHLATHADAIDSITPWIAFYDQKILLDELYLTRNNADLVVLSGCNTLKGRQETGEGVMSLARGFFYAGAKSVISSLWSVDDRSTVSIMNDFYKNLKDKKTKSQSLREAKLNYLKNSSSSERSPHFWASFVLLGDPTAITNSPSFNYWLFLLIPLIMILFIIYRKKKKSRS